MSDVSSSSGGTPNPKSSSLRTAYKPVPLVNDFQGKIECLAHYAPNVIVGTSDGRLVTYDLRKAHRGPTCTYTFPHKKKIDQIEVVIQIQCILVLSDGQVTCHSTSSLEVVQSEFGSVRGAKVFCINQRGPPHFRVCISLRKKVVMFSYVATQKIYTFLREFNLPDTPETLIWYRNLVCIGYRREYCFMNDKSGEITPINLSIDYHRTIPLAKFLPKQEIIFAAMERLGVFLNFQGEPLPKNSLVWSNTPTALEYSFPYIISVMPKIGVEIHSLRDQAIVQTLSIPKVTAITGNGMKWDMQTRSPGDSEDVVLLATSSPSSIVMLEPVSFEQQVTELIDQGKISEALDLHQTSISTLPQDKQNSRLRRFHRQAGISLLKRLEFNDAISHMIKCDLDPRELIAFFPELQSKSFAFEPVILNSDVLPRGGSSSADMAVVISESLKNGIMSDSSPKQLLASAALSLTPLLEASRQFGGKKGDPRLTSAIDNAQFRLFIIHGRFRELENFLEGRNEVEIDVEEGKALLLRYRMYHETALLLQSRGMYKEALDVWSRLGSGEYLQTGRDGVMPSIKLLCTIDDQELVWVYSPWLLKQHPDKAMVIFTTPGRRHPFQSQRVLEHLKTIPNPSLAQKYLEGVVESKENDNESDHTRLAMQYIDDVVKAIQGDVVKSMHSSDKKKGEGSQVTAARKRLWKFLSSSSSNYNVQSLMSLTKRNGLYREFIMLCGRSANHMEALQCLLLDKEDYNGAEEYCVKYGKKKHGGDFNDGFMLLIEMCLTSNDPTKKKGFIEYALKLLKKHGGTINGREVLPMLPDDILISSIIPYLNVLIPSNVHRVSEGMLKRNLSNIHNLHVQIEKVQSKQSSVTIEPETLCRLCHKRIGDIVFAVYPNGVIVHYNCTNGDLSTCSVTGEKFMY